MLIFEDNINLNYSSKKYELTDEFIINKQDFPENEVKLYRIKALKDFGDVKKGDLGGYIENENNLSHAGNCWVYDEAIACYYSRIMGNAKIKDHSKIEKSIIMGDAIIKDKAKVYYHNYIGGNAEIEQNAFIDRDCIISNNTLISTDSKINESYIGISETPYSIKIINNSNLEECSIKGNCVIDDVRLEKDNINSDVMIENLRKY
jgi:NDP-sugar pyrophosphorylase family protein